MNEKNALFDRRVAILFYFIFSILLIAILVRIEFRNPVYDYESAVCVPYNFDNAVCKL